MPRAVNSLTNDGPSRLNSTGPTFAHRRPGRRAASASASLPLGKSKAVQLAGDAHGYARISERCGADGHERCARSQILARIGDIADTAHADDGHVDALANAARGEHTDGQQRGTAQPAAAVAESLVQ